MSSLQCASDLDKSSGLGASGAALAGRPQAPPRPMLRSRFRGVEWDACTRKWRARITVHSRKISLGSFATQEQAAM